MKLCINCKFYKAGETELTDMCRHIKSGNISDMSIREENITHTYYACFAMLAGICKDHSLFEPISLPQLVKEATQ